MRARAFGETLEVEVRNLPRDNARQAIEAAILEVLHVEALLRPEAPLTAASKPPADSSSPQLADLAELNAGAGLGPQRPDPRLLQILARSWDYCIWTRGAHGPLGGELNQLWGLPGGSGARPPADLLNQAIETASCDNLRLDAETALADLARGARLDLWGFARGFAVDRALAVLQDHGATNAYLEIGRIHRGLGPGPEGRGWLVVLPILEGFTEPLDEIWLRDQSLAMVRIEDSPLTVAGDRYAPFLDQRRGAPPEGVEGVVTVTENAVDAEAVAASMMILGYREGLMRLGSLRPAPSTLWLLGDGGGPPLITTAHWADLKSRRGKG